MQWVEQIEQQATTGEAEMVGAMVEAATEAAAKVETEVEDGTALGGYGQHGCGVVVVLGGAEAAAKAAAETTEARGSDRGNKSGHIDSRGGHRGSIWEPKQDF